MEIIDCFCGIGPWKSRDRLLPYRPEEMLELMDHFGIAQALVYGTMAGDGGWGPDANRIVVEATQKHERLIPALTLACHPYDDLPGVDDYVEAMRQCGARAAWLWSPRGQHAGRMLPWLMRDYLAVCSEKRIPLFWHAEALCAYDIHLMCSEFPELRLVLVGLGYGVDVSFFPLMRAHANVHISLGHYYIPAGGPMRFLEHFPAERLLFGSGLPQFSPGGLIGHVMYADVDEATKQKILAGNLKRLLSEVRL